MLTKTSYSYYFRKHPEFPTEFIPLVIDKLVGPVAYLLELEQLII